MTALDALLEPIRHSPQLLEAVDELSKQVADEQERRRRFYEEMTPEQKIEFIGGEVVLHSPARNSHLTATSLISRLLSTYVDMKQLGTVNVEKCLCVFPRNDYEPDVVFFGIEKTASLAPDTLKFPVPDLAVEVLSESTEARDRGVKFEDYALHGVTEYWIVDAETRVVEQYHLSGDRYELVQKSSSGELKSLAVEGFQAPVSAFFDEAENVAALRTLLAGP